MVEFVSIYTQPARARQWLEQNAGRLPCFICVLGFTETGLIPGISAAGATPDDRRFTAIADAEFLLNGVQPRPAYPLPPLRAGASPVLISRAVVEALSIPVHLFNAGLPQAPSVPAINLGGEPARCLSTGHAMDLDLVRHLFQQGLSWGEKLATQYRDRYLVIGECVVGGTTTALAGLLGLGVDAIDKVNSSHPVCNHAQKLELVRQGLAAQEAAHPLSLIAAVGDPMQIVVAGLTIAASRTCALMLAGGTQMLAVYALTRTIAAQDCLDWQPKNVVIGTTRWVAEDPTGNTIALAQMIGYVPLLATPLSFAASQFAQLRLYEQGYVKEGVGAGGLAIAAALSANWNQEKLLSAIEHLVAQQKN